MRKFLCLLLVCWAVSGNAINLVPYPPSHHVNHYNKWDEGLMAVFKGLDPKILQSEDEPAVAQYLLPYNAKVLDYVKDRYGEDLQNYFEPDDPMILFTGFLVAHFETIQAGNEQAKYEDPFQCIYYAIGTATGIKELISSYTALINGSASINTLLGVVKNFARRYVAWYLVGYTVYKFGDCMEWW